MHIIYVVYDELKLCKQTEPKNEFNHSLCPPTPPPHMLWRGKPAGLVLAPRINFLPLDINSLVSDRPVNLMGTCC